MALCSSTSLSSSSSSFSLNPEAPYFVPAAFLAAEDFSPEWWHLVQTCPAFRDYWLAERFDPDLQLVQEFLDDLDVEDMDDDEAFRTDLNDLNMQYAYLKTGEENLPPTSNPQLREVARKAGLDELSVNHKQNRRSGFNTFPHQEKPLKVISIARPQKPVSLRKMIQQPR